MIKLTKLYIIVVTAILLQSCRYIAMDFTDSKLKVINNADYEIFSFVNLNYPDTSYLNSESYNSVSPKDTGRIVLVNDYWSRVMKEVKIITIFFVSKDSMDKYDYTNWHENVVPLKKLALSEADLDSLNWTIIYP